MTDEISKHPESNIPVPEKKAADNVASGAADGYSGTIENAGSTSEDDEVIEGVVAEQKRGNNDYFRQMMDRNFLDYASYVIKDRAIPDVDDGLKPVQRRILWALYKVHDGRTHKVANIVGNAMHYHPHGNASIEDALVVLANKGGMVEKIEREDGMEVKKYYQTPYFIVQQGNFGNPLTGSPAAAGRYIECALSQLAVETMFDNDITEFVDTYDGREVEPVRLPAKVPSLLMLGSDGIAVGMATKIMPHNFNELLDAEIAELKGEKYTLLPDFATGGLMDAGEYADGNGRIVLRAKIDIEGRELVIREIPAGLDTEKIVSSIEKAAEKNKIKISSVQDYTTDHVEIRVTPTRGYDPEKTLQGLLMYTDCSYPISVNMTVIRDNRPVQMTVTEVLKRNVEKLLDYLKRELEIELGRQNELFHARTLAQIFFEQRIYKRIEECRTQEAEYAEVHAGLAPFRDELRRDVTDEDVDKLLALPVRRISRFDIEKNQRELAEIEKRIAEIKRNLKSLHAYAIKYIENLKAKYGALFPRRTEIMELKSIDRKAAALNNLRVGHDRKNGYIGLAVKCDDPVVCNEFDQLLLVRKDGSYKVTDLPGDKLFVGKLYECRKYDAQTVFGIIYRDTKTGKCYGKRSSVGGFIKDKEYIFCPKGCVLELFTPRPDAVYELIRKGARKNAVEELNLMTLPRRSAKARGIMISNLPLAKITWKRFLSEEELAELNAAENSGPDTAGSADTAAENGEAEETPEKTELTVNPGAEKDGGIPEKSDDITPELESGENSPEKEEENISSGEDPVSAEIEDDSNVTPEDNGNGESTVVSDGQEKISAAEIEADPDKTEPEAADTVSSGRKKGRKSEKTSAGFSAPAEEKDVSAALPDGDGQSKDASSTGGGEEGSASAQKIEESGNAEAFPEVKDNSGKVAPEIAEVTSENSAATLDAEESPVEDSGENITGIPEMTVANSNPENAVAPVDTVEEIAASDSELTDKAGSGKAGDISQIPEEIAADSKEEQKSVNGNISDAIEQKEESVADLLTLEMEEAAQTRKRRRTSKPPVAEKKRPLPEEKSNLPKSSDDGEDDLGIVQPELEF